MAHWAGFVRKSAVGVLLFVLFISFVSAGPGVAEPGENAIAEPAGTTINDSDANATVEDSWRDEYEGETFRGGEITDDGYVLVGGAGRNGWIVGTNTSGSVRWRRDIQDTGYTRFDAVVALPDTGYVVVGFTNGDSPYGLGSPYAVRIAENGSVVWQHRFSGDRFWDVEVMPDGDVVVGGSGTTTLTLDSKTGEANHERFPFRNVRDVEVRANASRYAFAVNGDRRSRPRIVITEPNGSVIERQYYGERGDILTGLDWTSDGGFVASGIDYDEDRHGHGWGFKTTPNLTVDWTARPETVTLGAIGGVNGTMLIGSTNTRAVYWIRQNQTLASLPFSLHDIERGDDVALVVGQKGASVPIAAVVPLVVPDVSVDSSSRPTDSGPTRVEFEADVLRDDQLREVRWDFDGDGNDDATTVEPTTHHSYDQPGSYSVTVTAIGAAGTRVSETHQITVADEVPPQAKVTTPPNGLVAANRSTRLFANGSFDNYGIAEYRWDIGADGSIEATTEAPFLDYTFAGPDRPYQVAVTVVDTAGHTNSTSISLRSVPNDNPRIRSVSNTAVGRATQQFDVSVDNRVGRLNVTWMFPDGTTKRGTHVRHRFSKPGRTYTVRVTASDEYGVATTESLEVAVSNGDTDRSHGGWMSSFGALLRDWLALFVSLSSGF